MSIQQWALEAAVKGVLNDAEKDGKIETAANSIEQFIQGFFPGKEKEMKRLIAERILIPLSHKLTKEK